MKPFVLRRVLFLLACCLLPAAAVAADLAITSATVHVGNGEVIQDGTVLVSEGQITAVGGKGDVEIPPGVQRIDAKGLHLIPGMIDLRSLELVPESTAPFGVNSRIAVIDGLDSFERWGPVRDEGVTTVAVSGAGGSTQSSLGAILKLRRGVAGPVSLESLLLKRESHIVLSLGMAGTTSTSAQRIEQYYALRRQMAAALKYTEAWEKYWKEAEKYNKAAEKFNAGVKKAAEAAEQKKKEEKKDAGASAVEEKKDSKGPAKKPAPAKAAPKPPKPPKLPKRPKADLAIEAMSRALKGDLTVFIEAHRADDVRYALRLHDEFKFDFTLLGAGRAGPVAKELAASGITVALGPVLNTSNDLRRDMKTERLAGVYAKAGIPLVISSGAASAESSRYLRMQACAAVRGGLDPEKALEALTLQPAKRLGLEKKTGSIEKGKAADLVLLDGPPLDIRSRVVSVFVEGAAGTDAPVATGQVARGPEAGLSFAPLEGKAAANPAAGAVLKNAVVMRIAPGGMEVISKATVVIRNGKIDKVTTGPVKVEAGFAVYDLAGRCLLPGFIDAHSHLTLKGDVDDLAIALNDDLRVMDSFDPWDREIGAFLSRGVTTVALSPGRNNVVGGEISMIKLLPGGVPLRVLKRKAATKVSLVPNLTLPRYPTSLSGAADAFAQWLKNRYAVESKVARVPVVAYFENITQVERSFALARTHKVPITFLEGVGIDGRTFGRLPAGSRAILGPYSIEEPERVLRAPAILEEIGVPFSWATSGTLIDPLSSATLAMVYGLSEAGALRSLTTYPAALYGVDSRIGRLEKGADADLVVWDGNPLSLTAAVNMVFIDGKIVFKDGAEVAAAVQVARTETDRGVAPLPARIPAGAEPVVLEPAVESTILIRARKVYTVSGEPLEPGQVLVRSGRIVQLGKRIDIDKNTPGLMVIDVPGSLCPGLIDGGSGLGIDGRRADEFREMTPGLPVLLGADLDTVERRRALQSGVTAALLTPGDRNVIGGLAAVIKTNGDNLSEAVLNGASSLSMCLTQMASSGNRTLRSGRPSTYLYRIPTTRMGTVFLARRALLESVPGGWDSSNAVGDLKEMLTTSEREVVREVLAGKRTLRIRAQARYEILTALRIAGEFGLQVQIEGAREAIHLVSLLKEKKASVFLAANERWSGRELEANLNLSARLPAELHKAGVPFAFYSDSASAVAGLRDRVTWCVRRGLPESAALEALTLGAARMLGVSKRVGSIEPGKDADLVAFGGSSPFDVRSAVLWVMVDGKIVADPFQGEKPVERPRAKINKRRSLVPQGDF